MAEPQAPGAQIPSATGGTRGALDDVLITGELARRASRSPDHAAEARAVGALAGTLATDPRGLLQ